jgi:hypothetical protein
MSVALLIKDTKDDAERLVPVATQQIFLSKWMPGAAELGLEWIDLMETGFVITAENRDEVVAELGRLRGRMSDPNEIERLDRLVRELSALRFDLGATAFIG